MRQVEDVGINLATEKLKENLIAVINNSKLPSVCIKLACREVMEAVNEAYRKDVAKEQQERLLKGEQE